MTKLIVVLSLLLHHVLCRSLETDLSRDPTLHQLEKSNIFYKNSEELSKYNTSRIQAIHADDITLFVYTQAKPNGVEINLTDASNLTKVSPFNLELKTIFFVHGWLDTVNHESSVTVRNALLETSNVNIIIVNWDTCATSIDYFASKRCVPDVGKYVGQFLQTMAQRYNYSLSDVTVVGHSLGAHIAGHIGKYTNGTLGVIVGLDPAGPFYFEGIKSERLTEDDAQYVQAIHTDALFLGVNFKTGHADFWPNGGFTQTGCGLDAGCSHNKAFKYYTESLTNNTFYARQCDSFNNFKDFKCDKNTKSLMAGVNVNTSATGYYYLHTNSNSPYGMGDN